MSANVRERARIDAFVIEARVRLTAVAVIVALEMNALRRWISCSLSGASTDRHMVACETFRVSTADAWRIAWIRASVVDAGGRVRAVGVRETVSGLLATGFERVPYQTVRANAGKRPLRVLACS